VINFRSEGRGFPKTALPYPGVALLRVHRHPPKSKWKFTKTGEDWFCFAGLWRPMPDGARDAFTT
jgi:putative SOS response-associated peptidase YedK